MKSVDLDLAKGTAIVLVEWVRSWPGVPVQVGQAVILGQKLECGSEFARWCVELVYPFILLAPGGYHCLLMHGGRAHMRTRLL